MTKNKADTGKMSNLEWYLSYYGITGILIISFLLLAVLGIIYLSLISLIMPLFVLLPLIMFTVFVKRPPLHIRDRLLNNLREYFRLYLVIAILASAAIGGIIYPPISLLTLIGFAVFVFWYVGGLLFFR
jgi:hypothetical protein